MRLLLLHLMLSATSCSAPVDVERFAAPERAAPAVSAPAQDASRPAPELEFDHEHARWTAVLRQHVHGDRFDYKALAESRGMLDEYLGMITHVTPEDMQQWSREQRYAFWINAYNAWTIHLVVKNYPLESIRDLGELLGTKVWDKRFIGMELHHPEGKHEPLSLDDIEHKILRPQFKDARVHVAVNCASEGCPPLLNEAFVAERLGEQLDARARAWLADRERNRFDAEKRVAHLSAIFDWFREDFVRDADSVEAWVAQYAPAEHAAWLTDGGRVELRTLDYSWKLNDVER